MTDGRRSSITCQHLQCKTPQSVHHGLSAAHSNRSDLEPVGDYDYLYYQGFSVGTPDLASVQVIGVEPHSPPNVAYSDAISSTFAGPALVAHSSGSKTKNFDLKSFYYACVDV